MIRLDKLPHDFISTLLEELKGEGMDSPNIWRFIIINNSVDLDLSF